MHLPDGLVSAPLAGAGLTVSAILTVWAARSLRADELPRLSMVTSALFVGSLFHIPLMGTSVHFTLVGLAGILLGRRSFLSVAVAVLFQFVFFRHGGLAVWGLNTLHMGLGALAGAYAFAQFRGLGLRWAPFAAGWVSAVVKVGAFSGTLLLADFPAAAAATVLVAHGPVIALEGLLIGLVVSGLQRAKAGDIIDASKNR